MKFLLFNIVVAAALVYLFTGGGLDMQAAADRAAHVATHLKQKARDLVGPGSHTPARQAAPAKAGTGAQKPDDKVAPPAPAPARPKPRIATAEQTQKTPLAATRQPAPATVATGAPNPEDRRGMSTPVRGRQETRMAKAEAPENAPESLLPTRIVTSTPPKAPTPYTPPEIAKRRAIVLGTSSGKRSDKSTIRDTGRSGSKVERARQLMLLAEEMELFSAQTIGQ